MTRIALKNPIAVLMACVALLVFSLVVAPRMSVDTFPELTPPVLVIGTQVPGMGPKDVEKTITWRLEKFVSATPGIDHVQSVSRNGLSVIYVWLKWGTDLNAAQSLVQQQVAFAMSSVPKSLGVVPPFVLQYDPSNAPVIQIAVYGGGLGGPQLYDFAANNIAPQIEGIQGVASASPNGGRERQINVVVDPVLAASRGVTSAEVSATVSLANTLLPSGKLLSRGLDANVYTDAVPRKIEEIGRAVVKIVEGRPVLVQDVARVEDGGSPNTQYVSINGEPAVYLNVLRVPGGNVLAIVDAVSTIGGLQGLPPGLKVEPIFDQSTFVRTTVHGLQKEILQALVLVAGVILLFLQSPRSVLVACISVPVSFAVILLVLYATGQTFNAFTLGGLTLAMGPLVDISVVVLESVHQRQLAGKSRLHAALEGTSAVAVPALSAALATVAVLMPVALLAGLAEKLFTPLALTVASAMITGYLVSMMVTPVACRYLLAEHHREEDLHGPESAVDAVSRRVQAFIDRVALGYTRALQMALARRAWVVGGVAALVAASGWVAVRLPSSFFPEIDESMERVYIRFAPGTSLDQASEKMDAMARVLRQQTPGCADLLLVNVGTPAKARSAMNSPNSGPHMGFLRVALASPEQRSLSQREVADKIRSIYAHRNFPGVDLLQWPGGLVASVFSNGYQAPIVVEVRGDNLDELGQQSLQIAEVARGVAGVRDVMTSLELDYPEVRVETDRTMAGLVGVSARGVAQATLDATLGNINAPAVWVDGSNGQSYYVVTGYDGASVDDPAALAQIPVRATADGGSITLGSYGRVARSVGPVAIERNALARSALVMMQTEGRDVGSAAAELEERLASDPRTRNFKPRFVGQVELMRTTFGGLGVAVALAVMVVFMIMAVQFRSLRLPFAMLFTIPASLVGIVLALMLAGQGFSITALMGVLMVIGIAVSNGILLVDHARGALARGLAPEEAILEAGRARFIPIAMTSLATIIGLLPTALGLERGAEANRPLALAVVGGLSSSSVLSLFLVPVMFLVLARAPAPDEADAL